MLATVPAITRTSNFALRAKDMLTNGQRTLRSTTTNSASSRTATMNATTVAAESHPHFGARSKVNVNSPIPVMISAKPLRSSRRGTVLSEDSLIVTAPMISEITVNGTLSQKIARQPTVSVRRPPMSGPAAFPNPAIP